MRTTKAFGHELDEPARLAADRERRARSRAACAAYAPTASRRRTANVRVSGVPISTSVPSTAEIAPAAEAIIWFIASDTADSSSSDSSGAPDPRGCSSAHHRRGEAARALERHDEQVAAGDAVDVGRRSWPRPGWGCPRAGAVGATTATSPGVDLPGREHLEHAADRLRGGLAQPEQRVVGGHRGPPRRGSVTWTARRPPLRPGRPRCTGTSSANSVTPSSAGRVEAQDVAGLQREHLLDRQLDGGDLGAHGHLDAADGAAHGRPPRPRRGSPRRRRGAAEAVRDRARSPTRGAAARAWRRRRSAAPRSSASSVGSLTGAVCAVSRCVVELADGRARGRPCRSRSIDSCADQAVEEVPRERPVDVGQPALGAGPSRSAAAEQQLDRAQHQRRLGAQHHPRPDRRARRRSP